MADKKMKLHKIKNVSIDVCAAEQKIAYNIAFSLKDYGFTVKKMMEHYRLGYSYKPNRYNEEAIETALNNGFAKYVEHPFIASNYEIIGETFTL